MDYYFWIDKFSVILGFLALFITVHLFVKSNKQRKIYYGLVVFLIIAFLMSRGTYAPRNSLPNVTKTNPSVSEKTLIQRKTPSMENPIDAYEDRFYSE